MTRPTVAVRREGVTGGGEGEGGGCGELRGVTEAASAAPRALYLPMRMRRDLLVRHERRSLE